VLTLASEKSLPSTGVKIALVAARFHGFGVTRQGPWNTSVNKVIGTSRDTHQMLCPRAPRSARCCTQQVYSHSLRGYKKPSEKERRRIKMTEQAQKVRNKAVPEWAEGLYYNKGLFSEALIYHDDDALYFEVRGKDDGIVRFSHEMLETLKEVVEDEEDGASAQ
jgi:hypothetical protein